MWRLLACHRTYGEGVTVRRAHGMAAALSDRLQCVVIVRHKLVVRATALAAVVLAVESLATRRDAQGAVVVAIAVLFLSVSLRGLVIVRDDVLYRRGLFGWEEEPLVLDELVGVSLRREMVGQRFPLVLRLSSADRAVDIEVWAWRDWRRVAHLAGHFAEALHAEVDDVTRRRVHCRRHPCDLDAHVRERVAGRLAGAPPAEPSTEALSLGEGLPPSVWWACTASRSARSALG